MITMNHGIECHIPLDLSGIVAFSTSDLSTSFIQFDLSDFSACRSQDGQLDLVSGGWSAPDEAITTYDDILDNFMIGQRFLKKEFDMTPRVSW